MSLYVDSSAFLKLYVDEGDSADAVSLVASDPTRATARLTVVEIRRNLSRVLEPDAAATARRDFTEDLEDFAIVELDAVLLERAATIAETTQVKSLDAIHLAAAQRAGGADVTFITFDLRQAQAARSLGLTVRGA